MKVSLCFLVASVTLLDPAAAHFWPHHHSLHSPNELIEPNGFTSFSQDPSPPAIPPNRFWKSDSVFLFRPIMMTTGNGGRDDQRMRMHNPLLERLMFSPYRRSRFSNFYKDWNMDNNNKRRRHVKGIKGEINVKWAVLPIWERNEETDSDKTFIPPELLRRSLRKSIFTPRLHNFLTMSPPVGAAQPSEQQAFAEDDTENDAISTRRSRRQISSWNPQKLLNRLLSNATGIFDSLGRQMSRQLQTSTQDGGGNGVFHSVQQNFKRFVNLNMSQLKSGRLSSLFSQIASLTRRQ